MRIIRTILVLAAVLAAPAFAQSEAAPLSYQEALGRFLTTWYQRTAPTAPPVEKTSATNSNGLTLSLTPPAAPAESPQEAVGREGQMASYAFRQAYLEALRCDEGVRMLEALRKQAEECQKVAEEMNRGGQVPTFDIHQLKTLVLRMEEGLARARATREGSQARLVYLLSQPRGSRYALSEHLLPKPDPVLVLEERDTKDLDSLGKRALTQRPELQELARILPQRSQGAQIGLSVNNLSPNNYRHDGNVVGMLSASLPLGADTLTGSGPRQDSAQRRALEEQVLLEVEQAWWAVQEADKSFELSALAADHAAEAVRLGRIRYGVGATPAGELVNALSAQSDAQLNLLQAAYDQPIARLKLALAVGVLP